MSKLLGYNIAVVIVGIGEVGDFHLRRAGHAGAFFPAIVVIINQAGPRFAGWFLGVRLNQGYTIPKTLPDQAEFTAASTYFPFKLVHQ